MKKVLSIIAVAFSLSACGISSAPPEGDYNATSTYGTQEVIKVKIISKKQVKVASNKLTGKVAGAVIGGVVVGNSVGGSNGEKTVGAILGALAGSAIGSAIEEQSADRYATEYVIESETGDLQAVVVNDSSLLVGDKAFLILSDRPVLRRRK